MLQLGPISLLDCAIFIWFLIPRLMLCVGPGLTGLVGLRSLPFFSFQLPYQLIRERYFTRPEKQSPFVRTAELFEDLVVRCVRYAFANMPPTVGRVFFSKDISWPLLRFRMFRHGYLNFPGILREWRDPANGRLRGMWLLNDTEKPPDVCIYYAHGGGFSMGSSYFYLEFLLTWFDVLKQHGYRNPAVFSLEYTLVPDGRFPTQLEEAVAGYDQVLSVVKDPARVCFSGDSAGGNIMLGLLLHIANRQPGKLCSNMANGTSMTRPQMAAFISPWVTLVSPKQMNTSSDYLDAYILRQYARQYAGDTIPLDDPLTSPGNCRDAAWWKQACPPEGIHFAYGAEEVFAAEIDDLVHFLQKEGVKVSSEVEANGIHAWPVVAVFVGSTREHRMRGVKNLVRHVRDKIQPF